jgi:anti-anti-sigma factor
MPVHEWSSRVMLADLRDEPQFTQDLQSLSDRLDISPIGVVLNMQGVTYLNSQSIAAMLQLRQRLVKLEQKLVICGVPDRVWGIMVLTSLDKVFTFTPDVPSALSAIQGNTAT